MRVREGYTLVPLTDIPYRVLTDPVEMLDTVKALELVFVTWPSEN